MADDDEARGRLASLTIEGFRGFREPVTLDMNASAVLLRGPNGTGKTSVFDAIQWLVRGDVPRLASYTLRKNEEYLANAYRADRPARVEAVFELADGRVVATRTGNSAGGHLEVAIGTTSYVGSEADRMLETKLSDSDLPIAEVLSTSGLLQQDDLRNLLETKSDERYRQLLRLLGLEVLERFERFVATEQNRARTATRNAREVLDTLMAQVTQAEERLETARIQADRTLNPTADAARVIAVVDQFSDTIAFDGVLTTAEDLAALGGAARGVAGQLRRDREVLSSLPADLPDDTRPLLDAAEVAVVAATEKLGLSAARHALAHESLRAAASAQDSVARLAAAALPLLVPGPQPSACPVCGTLIDGTHVADELRARAATAESLSAAQAVADAAAAEVRRTEAELLSHQDLVTGLASDHQRRMRTVSKLRQALTSASRLFSESIGGHLKPLFDLSSTAAGVIRTDGADPEGAAFSAWVSQRREIVDGLDQLANALEAIADSADAAAAAASAARLAADRSATLPRQQAHADELRSRLAEAEAQYDVLRRNETNAVALSQSATTASEELFRARFSGLEPLMNDIYGRLDPHPAFKQLDFRVETYRSRGTATANVVDLETGVQANPMLVFSSAQANAVVLAAFLALGWAAGNKALPFVLLDDPLQSLDDVNVLGFADLARRIRRQRQIVIATHEERFAVLLERKLISRSAGEDLIVHEFRGWSRAGPTVSTRRLEPRPQIGLAFLAS